MRKHLAAAMIVLTAVVTIVWARGAVHSGGKVVTMNVGTDTAAGRSYVTVDIPIEPRMYDYRSLKGFIRVDSTAPALRGIGAVDSTRIKLISSIGGQEKTLLDTSSTALPFSVTFARFTSDTAFNRDAFFRVRISDSTSDSVFTTDYRIVYECVVRE